MALDAASKIRSNARGIICDGYIRGKVFVSDIDVIVTHLVSTVNLLHHIIAQLDVLEPTVQESNLEIALAIIDFLGVLQRVDIVMCPWDSYATAILGCTGATMFERDLRHLAAKKGLKFPNYGLFAGEHRIDLSADMTDTDEIIEHRVFHALDLEYVPPKLRNTNA